jgi:hypothetical protein
MTSNTPEESDLVKALKARLKNRPFKVVQSQEFIGAGDKTFGSVAVRVATKGEENSALLQAQDYMSKLTPDKKAELKDPDIVEDVKTVHILHAVIRDARDPHNFPAFPSPAFMMQTMTRDEVGALLNISVDYQSSQSPLAVKIDDDAVEVLARGLAEFWRNPQATQSLFADKSRAWLEEALVLLSVKYDAAKTTIGAQHVRIENLEGRHQASVQPDGPSDEG